MGPMRGFMPERLMWSEMSIRHPAAKSRFTPPAALVRIRVLTPSRASTRTGRVTSCWV